MIITCLFIFICFLAMCELVDAYHSERVDKVIDWVFRTRGRR